nr:AMP-binding protein [uncultured Catonella sp.]
MMWNLTKFGENIAVITETSKQYTYNELNRLSEEIVKNIDGRCLVMCLCKNETAPLLGYVSFINNKIVPLMVDSELEQELLDVLIDTYKPDYLWCPNSKVEELDEYVKIAEVLNYSLIKTGFNKTYPMNEELALLLTTSGSTGSPKLVRQTYKNLISNTESIIKYLELTETERAITTLPMNYTYGLSIINTHLYVGASIILTDTTLMQKEFWNLFKSEKATSFGGVPYIFEMLEKLRFFRMELPSLRYMTQAGGKLSPELHKKFAEYARDNGKKFVVMYGQTEATARMAYLPADKALEKYGSMGIAIPGGKFTLIDVDGEEITKPDIVGELVYEGANVAMGYATSGEDLIKGDEWFGKNITGDMAKRDSDGYYYITGRKKRFLKIFGSRVNLDETERLVKSEFTELDCVCGGVDDKIYVFLTDEKYSDRVKKFLATKLNFNSNAFKVEYIEKIPRNEAGKVLYKSLETYYIS